MNVRESKVRAVVDGSFMVPAPGGREGSASAREAKAIIESISDFYGTWDVSSPELCFSDRWLASLGYSPADLSHEQGFFERFIHPDDRAIFESELKTHLAGRAKVWNCECRIRTKAGDYRWFEIRGKIARTSRRGAPVQLAGIVLDVDARKHQQNERAAWLKQLSKILQNVREPVWIVDPEDFALLAFNKAYEERMLAKNGIQVRPGMRVEDLDPQNARTWLKFYRSAKNGQSCEFRLSGTAMHVIAECLIRDGQIDAICLIGKNSAPRMHLARALRQSEEKFSKAFLQGPLALTLTSTTDYRYIEVNDTFERYTGYQREEVIGKSVNELGLWLENDQRGKLIEELKSTGGYRNLSINFRNKRGEIRSGLGSAVLIELDGELCMLSMIMDVTEQKAIVEALRESEERLRIAIESGPMYAFEWDVATDLVRRSPQATELLGLPEGESHTKQELINRIHADDRDQYLALIHSLSANDPNYKTMFRLSRGDGMMIWLQESGRAFFAADGTMRKVVGISSDVSEIRRSEHTLRELSQRLISSQEEERRRIARELHDNIGQRLALLCIQAQRVDSGEAAEQHTDQTDVHELYERIKGIARDISKLSHRLHSSELNFLGLGVAAERLCRDFQNQYGIDVSCTIKNLPPRLDSNKSLCFYRVLQEALQNVAKHSQATRVIVELQSRKGELILKISDNGKGFDPGTEDSGSGLGLLSVRERLNLIGGEFALGSKAGFGTTLTAAVPIGGTVQS